MFWRALYQEGALFSASGNDFFADENDNLVNRSSANIIHNASISYDLSNLSDAYDKPLIVQLNVDNVLDRSPGDGIRRQFGDFNTSEILGRRFTFRVRASF